MAIRGPQFLERDPSKRLGCKSWSRRQGQSQLRGHRWFRDVNWEKLDARQLTPPFVPDVRSPVFISLGTSI